MQLITIKKYIFLLIFVAFLSSCSSSKQLNNQINIAAIKVSTLQEKKLDTIVSQTTISPNNDVIIIQVEERLVDKIVSKALSFEGYPYRFGGTTDKGMDCSGVVYSAYISEKILLPRTSRDMATKGKEILLENVQKGDLLFFKTPWNKHNINHVGLVVEIKDNEVFFIHATTSGGVIISKMSEVFWKKTFLKATTLF